MSIESKATLSEALKAKKEKQIKKNTEIKAEEQALVIEDTQVETSTAGESTGLQAVNKSQNEVNKAALIVSPKTVNKRTPKLAPKNSDKVSKRKLTPEDFMKHIDNKTILTGEVYGKGYLKELESDSLMIECGGVVVWMPREETHIIKENGTMTDFVGRRKRFIAKEILEDGKIIVSTKAVLEGERELLIARLQNGEEIEATVGKIKPGSAYLNYNGQPLILRNRDFSAVGDRTPAKDVLREGQKILVKLCQISDTKRIHVEAVNRYSDPTVKSIDIFERNQTVRGVIVNIVATGLFVNIAHGIDALCPIPLQEGGYAYEPALGDIVSIRIMQVNPDLSGRTKGRVRGKNVKLIRSKFDEDLRFMDENEVEELTLDSEGV